MNIQAEFNNQWRDIQNVVLSDAKRQIKLYGKVDVNVLNEKLQQETGKWQRGILVRGLLYREIAKKNSSYALLFGESAEQLQFTEPNSNTLPTSWWLNIICLIPVTILAIVLHYYTELSIIENIFYPTLLFVFLNVFCVPLKNKRKETATNVILADIEDQMKEMKRTLEKFL